MNLSSVLQNSFASDVENGSQPLVLIVREKEEVLGQVTVPLTTLPDVNMRAKRRFPLQPHRKCSNPQGELIFEGWVSKVREPQPPTIKITCEPGSHARLNPFSILKETIQKSPILGRRTHHMSPSKSLSSVVTLHRRNSQSLQDLSTVHQEWATEEPSAKIKTLPTGLLGLGIADTGKRCNSYMDLSVSSKQPQIMSVMPPEGPVEGGTVLTITGHNLGAQTEDVVGLFICGANCLGSIRYVSSTKIHCTAKAWRAVKGYIVVETQTGGRGTSLVQYRYRETNVSDGHEENNNVRRMLGEVPVASGSTTRAATSTPEPKRVSMSLRLEIAGFLEKDNFSTSRSRNSCHVSDLTAVAICCYKWKCFPLYILHNL